MTLKLVLRMVLLGGLMIDVGGCLAPTRTLPTSADSWVEAWPEDFTVISEPNPTGYGRDEVRIRSTGGEQTLALVEPNKLLVPGDKVRVYVVMVVDPSGLKSKTIERERDHLLLVCTTTHPPSP